MLHDLFPEPVEVLELKQIVSCGTCGIPPLIKTNKLNWREVSAEITFSRFPEFERIEKVEASLYSDQCYPELELKNTYFLKNFLDIYFKIPEEIEIPKLCLLKFVVTTDKGNVFAAPFRIKKC